MPSRRTSTPAAAGSPTCERRAFEVASYGKQLGLLTEVLLAVSHRAGRLSPEVQQTIRRFEHIQRQIEAIKDERRVRVRVDDGDDEVLVAQVMAVRLPAAPARETDHHRHRRAILEHIRLSAQQQFGRPVRSATLGRQVQFRSSFGEASNAQALEMLQAGAMGHNAGIARRHEVVVDIGGATSDVAHAEVGGDVPPRVRRAWGIARGGTDIDLELSLAGYMPLFGRGITRVPNHHYVEAATVHDLTREREFQRHDYGGDDAPYGPRLQALQKTGSTARLVRGVERSKIALSA